LGDPLPPGAIARLGTLRFKHAPAGDPTVDVAFYSPDGTKIVSLINSLRLWDAATGKEIKGPWNTPNVSYSAAVFSPDCKLLAVAANEPGNNGNGKGVALSVHLYEINSKNLVKTFTDAPPNIRALRFSDGMKTLVCAGGGTVSWWDIATGKQKRSWKPFSEDKIPIKDGTKTKSFDQCAFSPDATTIALNVSWQMDRPRQGGPNQEPVDQEAFGYDLVSGKTLWRSVGRKVPNPMGRFAFSADGKCVAVALLMNKVEVRDSLTGKMAANPMEGGFSGPSFLGGLALSSDGSQVALAGEDSKIAVWSTKEPKNPRHFSARIAQYWGNSTRCLHFSPDDKTLLVGADADLQVYEVATLREVQPWEGHRGWIDYMAFSDDGKRLLTGSADINLHSQELAGWEVRSWKRLQLNSLRTPPWPNLGVISPEQSYFVGKDGLDRLSVYDMATGKLVTRFAAPTNQPAQVLGFFSPSGKHFVLSFGGNQSKTTNRLYAVPTGKLRCELPPMAMTRQSMESVRPIAFSLGEELVALFDQNGMIHVLETATGKLRHRLGRAFSQDEGMRMGQFIANVQFAADGRLLATWNTMENRIHLWDVASGKELLQVVPVEIVSKMQGPGNRGRVHFCFSPDKRILAVGQTKIRLWELASMSVRHEFVGHQDGEIRTLAFSPDGKILASGSSDTTALIWEVPNRVSTNDLTLNRTETQKRWQALAENDAVKAYAAIRDLVSAPEDSVPWIKERIKPAVPLDHQRVEELIDQLNENQFKIRQKAMVSLMQMGEGVVPSLEKALTRNPTLESQLRIQDLQKRLTGLVLTGERLQVNRAIEVLERIGSSSARQALAALADGAPQAHVTTQARAALTRLKRE